MKKFTILLAFLAPLMLRAQTTTIQGTVSNADQRDQVFIGYGDGGIDSATIQANGFKLAPSISGHTKFSVMVGPNRAQAMRAPRLSVYAEPGDIVEIQADKNRFADGKVTGGKTQQSYAAYLQLLAPINSEIAESRKYWAELSAEDKKKEENVDAYRAKQRTLSESLNTAHRQFAERNPASVVSIEAIKALAGYDPDPVVVEPLFHSLSAAVQHGTLGKAYQQEIEKMKTTAVGAVAPQFSQADTLGKQVALSSFRGKYVLLDFWASWCGPCRVENPHVVSAFHQYKDKNFTVLGVSLDNEGARDAWMKAIHDDKLQDWTQLSDLKGWQNAASQLYGVRGIPANFLIDPNGVIVAKNLRGKALEEKLSELLD